MWLKLALKQQGKKTCTYKRQAEIVIMIWISVNKINYYFYCRIICAGILDYSECTLNLIFLNHGKCMVKLQGHM